MENGRKYHTDVYVIHNQLAAVKKYEHEHGGNLFDKVTKTERFFDWLSYMIFVIQIRFFTPKIYSEIEHDLLPPPPKDVS